MRADLSPADVPWTVSRGDTTLKLDFTLARDGSPWTVDEALAQVRARRSRTSTLILELTTSVAGAVVSVGDGDDLSTVAPGVYHWDLQVTDGAEVLTVAGGSFQVLDDVSEEVVP